MSVISRRQMLHAAGAGAAALALAPVVGRAQAAKPVGFTLPKLPYAIDALQPSIDAKTMEIHHGRHHKAYVDNANALLKDHPKLLALAPQELLARIKDVPEDIRQGVINNVGGHSNHAIFWEIMGPKKGGQPKGDLLKAIEGKFKSFADFQKQLKAAGMGQFGSGWAWLVLDGKGELEVVKKANQDSPYMAGQTPLVGVDVWEHAYYLKYQNKRADYIDAWWNVVNWDKVAERYAKAKKG